MTYFQTAFFILLIRLFLLASNGDANLAITTTRKYPNNCISIYDNIFIANFVDCSGNLEENINWAFLNIYGIPADVCQPVKMNAACVTDDYFPCSNNITNDAEVDACNTYLIKNVQSSRNFDLQTSVKTFLSKPQFSSFDPKKNMPPFAIIHAFDNPISNANFKNGVDALHKAGFEVLIISTPLPVYAMGIYLQSVAQTNVVANHMPIGDQPEPSRWLKSRIYSRYIVPTVNQTAMSGAFTSQNYPNNYPYLALQEFYISAPSDNYRIQFTLTDFETNRGYDYLICYDDVLMTDEYYAIQWYGLHTGENYTFFGNAVSCRFCGGNAPHRGFNVTWKAIPK